MTSIPVAICRICGNNLKHHDLEIKRFFMSFYCISEIAFLKCAWNLEHFQKKDEYASLIISEIIDAERRGYLNV